MEKKNGALGKGRRVVRVLQLCESDGDFLVAGDPKDLVSFDAPHAEGIAFAVDDLSDRNPSGTIAPESDFLVVSADEPIHFADLFLRSVFRSGHVGVVVDFLNFFNVESEEYDDERGDFSEELFHTHLIS